MAQMVLGIFSDRDHANKAVGELQGMGYNPKDMSIIMKDEGGTREVSGDSDNESVAGGAVTGATTGGAIGALAGLLVGVGAIAIPGIGALLIGGPLAAALGLTGAAATTVSGAVTGALAGGLIGALVNIGVPEERARFYEERIKRGGVLLAVPTKADQSQIVQNVLRNHNADQLSVVDTV